jgi:hypothetical protein
MYIVLYLIDIGRSPQVLIVVPSFLRVGQHSPGLRDALEGPGGFGVRILVRVHQHLGGWKRWS